MGEERCAGKRETDIYRIHSPRQNVQGNGNNLLKYNADNVPHVGILQADRQTGTTVWG
jgi:hypothetical protein